MEFLFSRFRKVTAYIWLVLVLFNYNAYAQKNPHGKISWDCNVCHTEEGWTEMKKDMAFDHSKTGFKLTGKHAAAACTSCHRSLKFARIGILCSDCHQDIHQARLGNQCETCHSPFSWNQQKQLLEKHVQLGFPLTGVHLTVDCEGCHQTSDEKQFTAMGTDCVQCHGAVFEQTQNPSHVRANFSKNCKICHSMGFVSWKAPSFTHTSAFPLQGAHRRVDCNACHSTQYKGLSRECINCHQDDYDNSRNPNHKAANFPLQCGDCHTENAWTPASFDHSTTNFPLTGAHKNASCASCHINGNYTSLSTDCYSCHQTDYEQANDPNHAAAHFSTQCTECHNTTNWNQVTWDHDSQYFPIYSGSHRGEWNTCNDCHVNSNDFTAFECINCHEHNQSKMDDKHKDEKNYVYQSDACYNCHPNGKGD